MLRKIRCPGYRSNGVCRTIGVCVTLILALVCMVVTVSGCGSTVDSDGGEALDYTVVEWADVPVELQKLINEKKENTLRLTFSTKDYTYIVAGYGTQETSGYSIRVNGVTLTKGSICGEFSLIGPAVNEPVTEKKTQPFIVLKIEKRDESIVFRM